MPSRLIASYTSYVTIEIPKDVQSYLLSVDENVLEKEGQPGSWYIRWGDLHYYDKEGKEQVIEGGEPDTEYKRPNTVEEENDATPVVSAHQKMMELRKMVEDVRSLFIFDHLTPSSEKYFKVEYDEEMSQRYKVGTVISVFTEGCNYKPEFDEGEYEPFSCMLNSDFLNYKKMKELGYACDCQSDYHFVFYKSKSE